jgi:hypothetical protein
MVRNQALLLRDHRQAEDPTPAQFIAVGQREARLTASSRVFPGESLWVCLVEPIPTQWIRGTVLGAELAGAGPYQFELRFSEPLPKELLEVIITQIPEFKPQFAVKW